MLLRFGPGRRCSRQGVREGRSRWDGRSPRPLETVALLLSSLSRPFSSPICTCSPLSSSSAHRRASLADLKLLAPGVKSSNAPSQPITLLRTISSSDNSPSTVERRPRTFFFLFPFLFSLYGFLTFRISLHCLSYLRSRRTKLGLGDFRTVKVIGKGAFGEVRWIFPPSSYIWKSCGIRG